jgi:hypothetical protein
MELKVDMLVKLKDYSAYAPDMKDGVFYVKEPIIDGEWFVNHVVNGRTIRVKESNIKIIKLYNINRFFSKLAVGDIVVTDGNGSRQDDSFIVGKVGEIDSSQKLFFVWNNQKHGSEGQKAIVGFKYSFLIRQKSSGKIAILKKKQVIPEDRMCVRCEEEKDPTTLKKGSDDKLYCPECYDMTFIKCSECDEIVDKRDADKTPDGDIVCEDCFSDKCYHCTNCSEVIWQDDACCNNDGDPYCDDCYSEQYTHCRSCEEEIRADDCCHYDGTDYCTDCYGDRFTTCESCGEGVPNDDAYFDEENDEYFCQRCHRSRTGRNIHDYSYSPTAEFKKMKWEEDLFLGLELEVQHEEASEKSEAFIAFLEEEKVKDNFYLKHDSSIDGHGGGGFEIVSHPATLHYWHKQIKMKRIIDWLKKEEFQAEESGDCGIHIHISRAFFTDLEVAKLRLFFRKNIKQLKKFSRRELEGEHESDPYHYCMFEDFDDKSILEGRGQEKRYWALNLNSSRETIELRFFRASLDYKRFLAILQFSEAISRFVKKIGIAAFIYGEREYKNNSWKLFTDWAKEENKYKDMLNYFEKNNIVKESQEICA